MISTAAGLAVIAVALAWPVPTLLARASWPSRAPAIALLLWQAIALAGGLSMIGAPLVLAAAPYGGNVPDGLLGLGGALLGLRAAPLSIALLAAAAVLTVWLLAHLAVTIAHVTRQRRRHLALLELLSSAHPTRALTRVIDEAAPVAYCLPRGLGSATVLSRGLIDLLAPAELDAVVAHEGAHVRQRHDVVLVAFRAWHAALPRFPVAALAEGRVAELIEMLADDRARRRVPDAVLAAAISRVGAAGAVASAEASARRTARLGAPTLSRPVQVAVVAASVALVAAPTLWILLAGR